MAGPANVGPGGGLVGPGGGLVGPASSVFGDFAVSHGQTVTFAGTFGYKGTFYTSHDHTVVVAGFPTFMEELSGTFVVDLIHRTAGWTATVYTSPLPTVVPKVVGSGSMIYFIPEEASQIALEAHFLKDGNGAGRFDGTLGQLAFQGTADFPNTPYGGRVDIPTRGLLVPVFGATRMGEFPIAVQALASGHVVIGLECGGIGVAFDYIFVRSTVRINGEVIWSADHESGGGLRFWGEGVSIGTVDLLELIFTGDLIGSGFASEIEADVGAGAIITAGFEYVAGSPPVFLSVDPLGMGAVNKGHLWVAGTLGGEPLVASGSGSVASG